MMSSLSSLFQVSIWQHLRMYLHVCILSFRIYEFYCQPHLFLLFKKPQRKAEIWVGSSALQLWKDHILSAVCNIFWCFCMFAFQLFSPFYCIYKEVINLIFLRKPRSEWVNWLVGGKLHVSARKRAFTSLFCRECYFFWERMREKKEG